MILVRFFFLIRQLLNSANPARKLDMKNSETLRALMEENEKNNKTGARDNRGLKESRPAAPIKMVASNPHFKVIKHKIVISFRFDTISVPYVKRNYAIAYCKFVHGKRNDLSMCVLDSVNANASPTLSYCNCRSHLEF